jgi:hypothetical protein
MAPKPAGTALRRSTIGVKREKSPEPAPLSPFSFDCFCHRSNGSFDSRFLRHRNNSKVISRTPANPPTTPPTIPRTLGAPPLAIGSPLPSPNPGFGAMVPAPASVGIAVDVDCNDCAG